MTKKDGDVLGQRGLGCQVHVCLDTDTRHILNAAEWDRSPPELVPERVDRLCAGCDLNWRPDSGD
ncbi:hypothetical protein [Salana multivorans]